MRRTGVVMLGLLGLLHVGGGRPAEARMEEPLPSLPGEAPANGAAAGVTTLVRAPVRVAVVAPASARGRLGEELAQELTASGFAVSQFSLGEEDARAFNDNLLHTRADACVLVAADDRGVTIYLRAPGSGSAMEHTQLHGEAADRPSRRRLSLAVVERLRGLEGPDEGTRAAVAPTPSPTGMVPLAPPATPAGAPVAVLPASVAPAPVARRSWAFGASSALNLLSARGTPTGHVVLTAERKLNPVLDFATSASWPVLGAQYTDDSRRFIRTWTFDAQAGLNLLLRDRTAALRPVIGGSLGLRTALAEGEFEFRGSRVTVTPALIGAVSLGLRYRLRPQVDLILNTDLSRGLVLLTERTEYERDTAGERLLRIALGAVFEY
jgi:hypothetical protein